MLRAFGRGHVSSLPPPPSAVEASATDMGIRALATVLAGGVSPLVSARRAMDLIPGPFLCQYEVGDPAFISATPSCRRPGPTTRCGPVR